MDVSVVLEDQHFLALAKPFGMPSQPDPSGDKSLLDWARDYLGAEAHLIHRLDRPTGGLLLLAKTKSASKGFSEQFRERQVQKTYLAVTDQAPPESPLRLQHHIAKLPGKNFVRAYDKSVRNSKPADLTLSLKAQSEGLSLLEIRPQTGRRHQIRAQLRTLKLSILGDQKYGKSKPLEGPGIALWAYALELHHPLTGQPLRLCAPPPSQWPWGEFLEAVLI